jgi:energy-coupling factor transport system ATP-binding protein
LGGYIPHVIPGDLSGEIFINGIPTKTTDLPSLAVQASLCQQDPESQLCTLNVNDEVAFGPENLGLPAQEVVDRLQDALSAINSIHLKGRDIARLSGGEMQRIAIASMLAMRSSVLILDEPTSSLDPNAADEVIATIEWLRRERQITIIVIEHRLDRLLKVADRLIVLESGAITLDGKPDEVYRRYRAILDGAIRGRSLTQRRTMNLVGISDEAIHVRDLRFSYNDTEVLHGVSFAARKGELIGIIGPNGSGKTTFLNCLAGLCRPSSGVIRVNGINAIGARTSELARNMGFVFQNPNHQIFANTVFDEMTFACKNFGINKEMAERSARKAMADYGISRYAQCNPLTLSHGEKRRLNLCATLPHDPSIIILDEPFIAQDMANATAIMEDLLRLGHEGKTLLIVSHDMDKVFGYCDRIVFFDAGSIVADDIPSRAIGRIRDIGALRFLPGTNGNDYPIC